jgi:hypothetical protein
MDKLVLFLMFIICNYCCIYIGIEYGINKEKERARNIKLKNNINDNKNVNDYITLTYNLSNKCGICGSKIDTTTYIGNTK